MEVVVENWVGYAGAGRRHELERALAAVDPRARISFASDAEELREAVLRHGAGRLGVMVGFTGPGISDVNLAAAIARDGGAAQVVLVTSGASGSLKSRAMSAGIADVIDVALLPGEVPRPGRPVPCRGTGDAPGWEDAGESVPTTLVSPRVPSPPVAPQGSPSRAVAPQSRPHEARHEPRSGQWHVVGEPEGGRSGGEARGRGPVITFASGRGGVGKTTLVAVCAAIAASWGMKVALCDLDLTCGNLYSYFGLQRGADLTPVSALPAVGLSDLERIGETAREGIRLWGPCDRPEMSEVVMPHVGEVLDQLSAGYDLVLVDTPTALTDAAAQAAQACDRLVLVSDGGLGTSVALKRLTTLAVRLGVARTRIVRMANQSDPKGRDEVALSHADAGLETSRPLRVLDGGDEVAELLGVGGAADVAEAVPALGSSLATALAKILSEMGRLPSCEAAARAEQGGGKRRRRLFGRRRRKGGAS